MVSSDRSDSFPVNGGTCSVSSGSGTGETGAVRLDQSRLRHLHVLHFGIVIVLGAIAVASVTTDWRYVTDGGFVVRWYHLVPLAGLVLATGWGPVAARRARGYTGARTVPLDAIEGVRLTSTEFTRLGKQAEPVPLFVLYYDDGEGLQRRQVLLNERADADDLRTALDAFTDAGLDVTVDDEADLPPGVIDGGDGRSPSEDADGTDRGFAVDSFG